MTNMDPKTITLHDLLLLLDEDVRRAQQRPTREPALLSLPPDVRYRLAQHAKRIDEGAYRIAGKWESTSPPIDGWNDAGSALVRRTAEGRIAAQARHAESGNGFRFSVIGLSGCEGGQEHVAPDGQKAMEMADMLLSADGWTLLDR